MPHILHVTDTVSEIIVAQRIIIYVTNNIVYTVLFKEICTVQSFKVTSREHRRTQIQT